MTPKKCLNIKANGGRFGPGKVHFSSGGNDAARNGSTLCGLTVYGEAVDARQYPVTCKRCWKAVP